jgi:hypothetical protein
MTGPQDSADVLSALQEAIEHGDDRRSPLFHWMMTHYDQFAGMIQSARLAGSRPNWSRLAETFARYSFSDADGQPLKKHTVRLTWWRVRKAREKVRKLVVAPEPPVKMVVTQPSQALQKPQETPVRVQDSNEALAEMLAEMNRRSGRI